MESKSNNVLPYIIGIVVHKPDRTGRYEDILRDVQTALNIHNEPPPENLKEAVDTAIQQGKQFGLIYTKGEKIRVPFKIRTTASTLMVNENSSGTQDTTENDPEPNVYKPKRQVPKISYTKLGSKVVKTPTRKQPGLRTKGRRQFSKNGDDVNNG